MASISAPMPRVTIQFCTQCKWMLRAAYFAQELLSTFGTSLGEVALQPSTGGTFVVSLYRSVVSGKEDHSEIQHNVLWDRKAEGGFPETKELKRRVRDIIDPDRDLGHVDREKKPAESKNTVASVQGHRDSNAGQIIAEAESSQETSDGGQEQQTSRIPSNLHPQGRDLNGNSTPIATNDFVNMDDRAEKAGKRNEDGTVCEDCN